MSYEEEFRIAINNLFEKYNHEMSEIEKRIIEKFILNCKDNNISIKDGLEELKTELSQHTNINNDGNFEKFKNSIVDKLPTIPNHITEEWLLNLEKNKNL